MSFFKTINAADLVESCFMKLGDEPDPSPAVLKVWKEVWTTGSESSSTVVQTVPVYVTPAAQHALEHAAFRKLESMRSSTCVQSEKIEQC